jgi:hypothetical protein
MNGFSINIFSMSTSRDLADDIRNMHAIGMRGTCVNRGKCVRRSGTTAIVSSFFIAVVGEGLFLGAVIMAGALRAKDSSNELTADRRTARVARSLRDGTLCHYVVFDNKTAQSVEDRIGQCDENKPKPKPEHLTAFSWGGSINIETTAVV